jgi:hypothetical protein
VSGTKLELATKACNHVKLVHGLSISLEENDEQGRYNNTDDKYEIPEIADLNSGWTSDKFGIPSVTLIQPTISLEMPVPSQGHYGFHIFPVVD